ncbi:MAG TPA: hypothetical protein VIY48_22150 [Candidatus Paceibacterota bacterium]
MSGLQGRRIGSLDQDAVSDLIGLVATDKIGFYGATRVAQQASAAAGTDAATTQALANALRTALLNLGFIA